MQKLLITIIVGIVLLSGCSFYEPRVEQGNIVTKEMLAKVKIGMDQERVRLLLGSSLLNDAFHHDRWDYFYSLRSEGSEVEHHLVSLYFKGSRLVRIEGQPMQQYHRIADEIL